MKHGKHGFLSRILTLLLVISMLVQIVPAQAVHAAGTSDPLQELKTLVAECSQLKAEDYSPQTWDPFAEMLGNAEAAIERNEQDTQIISFAYSNLSDSRGRLKKADKPAVDKSMLEAAIRDAKALNESDYTDGSWGNLYVAIMMAESEMKAPDVTQEAINQHEIAVRAAMDALKKKIVVSELQAAMDEAMAHNEEDYTKESWAVMQEKLKAADDAMVYQKSQESVNQAAAALRQAVKDLQPNTPAPRPEGNVVQVGTAAEMPKTIEANTTVALTADITLEADQQIALLAGTLDGKGHTITLVNKALAAEVTGTVQNLGITGTVINADDPAAPITSYLNGGTVQNCFSTAEIKSTAFFGNTTGFVGTVEGGTIRNCYVAGKQAGMEKYGLTGPCNNAQKMSNFTNTYYNIGTKITSFGTAYNENELSVAKKNLDEMKTPEFAKLLNTNIQDTGYQWEVIGANLPILVEGKLDGTPDANTAGLSAAIKEAKALAEAKYTPETWAELKTALAEAEKTCTAPGATQEDMDRAEIALRAAIAGLEEKPAGIRTEAAALPAEGVIEISSQEQIRTMTAANTEGKFYRLANDIIIDDAFWYGTAFAGVLDGNGHTVTVKNKNAIFEYLTKDAVIQNIGFLGEVCGSGVDIGGVARDSNGLIVNCWNRMTVSTEGNNNFRKNTGSFVAHLKKGGAIVNCYAAGDVFAKGSQGAGVAGAFTATSEENTLVKNGMFLNTTAYNAVGSAKGKVENCRSLKRGGFYSQENLEALNANRGTYGKEWTIDDDGWFHLGAAGNFDGVIGSGLVFTYDSVYGKEPVTFDSGDGLELSIGDFLVPVETEGEMPKYLGYFSNPNFDGEIACVPEYTAVGQGDHGVMVSQDCGLHISHPGNLTVHVMDKASWSGTAFEKELTSFTIVITPITAEELRLIPSGKYVDPVRNTVAGSGNVTVQAQIKVNGQWMKGVPTGFSYTIAGEVFGEGDGFYATAPGQITIGCNGFGKSATLIMESTYVAVDSIMPFPHGIHYIHGRNANSAKLGDFLDLDLADHTGRVDVRPENASYRNAWKMESSDPKVCEYIPDFLLAVLPYKAGKATLTATSLDPNLQKPVTGSTQLELRYLNPVTAVSVNPEELDQAHYNAENGHMTLKGSEEILLPIHFTGTKEPEVKIDPNDGMEKEFSWHVSEPEMIWSQEGDGEVEIVRNGNLGMFVKSPLEYCVANDQFKIAGVVNGTVTVTGVPVDKTNKIEPVSFTVEVTGVRDPEPYDVQAFISEAKGTAIQAVKDSLTYHCGADEWQIVSLLRAGETLPQDKLEAYYQDVSATLGSWSDHKKPTEFERVALALSAMGKDITNVNGINLAAKIYNHKNLKIGSNEVAFALLALDARNTEIPRGAANTRESMVALLLTFQNEDGGFGLAPGSSSGADTTSMALQALAPYQNQAKVAAAIENGLVYLKNNVHTKSNHFDEGTVEANSQTMIAMAVLGRDLLKEPGFYSARYNLMRAMEPYYQPGEGFKHTSADPKINSMATVQALQAMDSYERFLNNKSGYWCFADQNTPEINSDGHAVALVLDAIHKLPDAADISERDRKNVEAARAEFEKLTAEQQALVETGRLEQAEQALADIQNGDAVNAVIEKINALPGKITLEDKEAVADARKAYNQLADVQKKLVTNADKLEAAEKAIFDLEHPVDPEADKKAAAKVMDRINKLPAKITLANKTDIEAARAAYDNLTDSQKKLVTNFDKLLTAESRLADLENPSVYLSVERFTIGQGFIIEPVAVAIRQGDTYADVISRVLGDRASIRAGGNYLECIRGADMGPEHVKVPQYIARLSNGKVDTASVVAAYHDGGMDAWGAGNLGEFTYGGQSGWVYHVNGVAPSTGIGETTAENGAVVRLQYTIYGLGEDVLNETVSNKDALMKAMATVNGEPENIRNAAAVRENYRKAVAAAENMTLSAQEVRKTTADLLGALAEAKGMSAEDQQAAKEVSDLIDAIGTVTKDSGPRIQAARNAYHALTAGQKLLVANYGVLLEAETRFAEMNISHEDQQAAKQVSDLIDAIGTVTLDSGKKINAARKAYNSLTDRQKKLVDNYELLVAAEKKLQQLQGPSYEKIYETVGSSMEAMAQSYPPEVGSVGGEWIILGLARSDRKVPAGYYDNVVEYVQNAINDKEQLHRAKSSDNSRVILALTSIGKDVTNVGGHNLLMGLTDMKYLQKQGINGPIWALIALDSHNYEIPTNHTAAEQATREKILNVILDAQLPDGGWDLSGRKGDADMTGMALQALAPYYKLNKQVTAAVDKALKFLSGQQNADGTFGSIDGTSSESSTQVIVALTALGIDPHTDSRFVKNGMSAVDGLLTFHVEDGFKHIPTGDRDQMATEQSYYALTAYDRFLQGKHALYNMSDISIHHVHSYRWLITEEATVTSTGKLVGTCSCGHTIQKEIPVTGVSGEITVKDNASNKFGGKLANKDIVNMIPLTEDEQAAFISGDSLSVILNVTDISETISKMDKATIQQIAGKQKVGLYLDISLIKQVGDANSTIHTTDEKIQISIEVPEALRKMGRTYSIVRLHNGMPTILECEFNEKTNELVFESNRFSTYALIYSDTSDPVNPQTGDEFPVALLTVTMAVSAMMLAAAVYTERKKTVR